jgi:prepilin-type N-terminal cleavage/methylation domain-containing protein
MSRGFTLVEMVICLAIFGIMTALVVSKYGNFNQGTLLTDTAYDIALVLHTAQSYGLSVHNAGTLGGTSNFQTAYGVDFNTGSLGNSCGSPVAANATNIELFADTAPAGSPDHICASNDTGITSYAVTRGATIYALCVGTSSCTAVSQLDITFLRPNPDATICANGSASSCSWTYGQITLKASDGSLRTIGVYQNGQIVVNK